MNLFDDLFNEIWNDFGVYGTVVTTTERKKCPVCGHTLNDFRNTGRLGCSECYNTFRPYFEETLRQIHSNSEHNGKIPSKSGEELRQKRHLEDLKAKLKRAVSEEDYELAAKLHKEIREIEG